LVRGLGILSSFTDGQDWGITELSESLGLNKSTVHRYVNSLQALGFLEQDPYTDRYRLGMRSVTFGLAALASMPLRLVALPYLEGLASEYGHSVNMAVLERGTVIYIERVRTKRLVDLDIHVGTRLPAYCTSVGKVLLADLPSKELEHILRSTEFVKCGPGTITDLGEFRLELELVRAQGYASSDQELTRGLRAVAVPVRDARGKVVAAINIALHAETMSWDEITNVLLPALLTTASKISSRMGHRGAAGGVHV
jgi:IclR family pca regulon transcriptional regulator